MSDLEKVLDSGNLEDIDKILSSLEEGQSEEQALASVESGDTGAAQPPADPPSQDAKQEPVTAQKAPEAPPETPKADEAPVLLAKDGKNHIPYSVLENERQQAATLKAQMEELSRKNSLLEKQLQEADIAPKDLPEKIRFTAEQLEDLETYGEVGSAVAILAQQNAVLMERLESAGVQPAAAAAPTPVDDNPLAANADTARWAENDGHWSVVETVNSVLDNDPVWAGKSLNDRIPEIVRRTKLALGEKSDSDVTATAEAAIQAAQRVAPNSLTDVGGEVPGQTKSVAEQLSEGSTLDVEEYLAKQTAAGKSMDDVLSSLLM
jgi:hypothetical protein